MGLQFVRWQACRRFAVAWLCGSLLVTATASAAAIDGTTWVLQELPGRALVGKNVPTLQFEQGKVFGSDGCNRYSGAYVVNGEAFLVSPLAGTQMACTPEIMEQARSFTSALTESRSIRRDGSRLELLAADGKVRATLAAQSTGLAGTSWRATAINNGKAAVVSLASGTAVTLAFGADGRASGKAGCNRYTAAYEADGTKLSFKPPVATRMMCAQPAGVMEQEQAFLKALTTVAQARVEGNKLTLRTASGAIAANFERAKAD